MSVLRRAWEARSLDAVDVSGPGGAWVTGGKVDGYGETGGVEPGSGTWLPGMRWESWASTSAASPERAMRLSAVFACLRLLSEAISTLPMDTFQRVNGARRPYRPRPAYLDFPLPGTSRITYLSQVMMSLLTDGNAFVAVTRDGAGVPESLTVLDPTRIEVRRRDNRGGRLFVVGEQTFTELEVMHIPGMMLPGSLRGVSPLAAAREVIDGGRKAQEFGTSFLGNQAMPPAVIELPDKPGADADYARRVGRTWNETHGGAANAGKVGVLIGGAKLTTVAVSPEDAQWLDSKRFGVSEVARFYGVPPHLIADASNSTSWGSGLAEQNLAFGQFSLRPWTERIEEAHGRLLAGHGLPDVFVKLNLDALLRASLTDRYESYEVGIRNGFLTVNEARSLEDLAPVAGGDDPPGGGRHEHERPLRRRADPEDLPRRRDRAHV